MSTVKPFHNFNADADAQELKKFMKNEYSEEGVINILCHRTYAQRSEIGDHFSKLFGKELIDEVKSSFISNFRDVISALLMHPLAYEAVCLNKAMKGIGTDERTLTEIVCSHTNAELKQIKSIYEKLYKKELEKHVVSETSGTYQRILLHFLGGHRMDFTKELIEKVQARGYEGAIDRNLARKEAEELAKAGAKKWTHDESMYGRIILNRDPCQLRAIVEEYQKITNEDIFTSIGRDSDGDSGYALQTYILSQISQPLLYARILFKSMKGVGTDNHTLNRVVVTRSEIDLEEVKVEFQKGCGKSLQQWIESETSGVYKTALLTLVK